MMKKPFLAISLFFFVFKAQCATSSGPYRGKLIDAVTQWPLIYSLSELSRKVEAAGVQRAGISINSFDPTKAHVEKSSKEIDANKLFYKGSPKYFHFASSLTIVAVDNLITEIKKNNYTYISEIMYRHADKRLGITTPSGERMIDPLSKESIYLMTRLSQNFPKLPIFIHWEFYQWKTDNEKFSKLFKMFPEQRFIINHMGFGTAEQIESLIKSNNNVFFTISKRNTEFEYFKNAKIVQGMPIIDKDRKIDRSWKKIFTDYSNRFLFATDSHKNYMWDNYSSTVKDYREILGQLSEAAGKDIAYKNAEKIFKITY